MFRRIITAIVDAAGRRPAVVLLLTLAAIGLSLNYTRKLELRSDFLELLPRDSPGFIAYEHQMGRVGGGATFNFVVTSPNRAANQKFVDDLSRELAVIEARTGECIRQKTTSKECDESFVLYFENGTKEVQSFYRKNKWLFPSLADLTKAADTLEDQIAIRSGLVADLRDSEPDAGSADPTSTSTAGAATGPKKKRALGADEHKDKWDSETNKHDDFPTGYFESKDGQTFVVRLVTRASGTGGPTGDRFLEQMMALVEKLAPTKYDPQLTVGFAGDIPNAKAEKDSIASEALWASVVAMFLVLGGIVVYFRSPWSLLIIGLPAGFGVSVAYAFATYTFGYVNTAGAFLGAIILGNGVNYPIVLFARYREFVARGMTRPLARREAVMNAFRAELVGASVAAIAYGSLTVTRFRGFSQFGTIGFVGMFAVWAAIVPLVPALIVSIEWLQTKLPKFFRDPDPKIEQDGTRGPVVRAAAFLSERYPWVFVIGGFLVTALLCIKLPSFIRDPWEYSFHNLGSRGSKQGGPGEWSNKADAVFEGKTDISGVRIMADDQTQVAGLKAQILRNDDADPQGKLIDDIITVNEFLPGTDEEQKKKLEQLERIRSLLTPNVIENQDPDEQKTLTDMKPPEDLVAISAKDLPSLIRRRFQENNGVLGTLMYVKYKHGVSQGNGRTALRIAKTTDNVTLPDGTLVKTASRATVYAEMIRSMERDGPLASAASFGAVTIVVILATHTIRGAVSVLLTLLLGVLCTIGIAATFNDRLNFLNFIALPITFGIGCEYPFNIYDRSRILLGDVTAAVKRSGGAVMLCSYTTIVGYFSVIVADQQAVQSFGRLAGFGEVACIVMAMLFLPSLLHLTRGKNAAVAPPPEASGH